MPAPKPKPGGLTEEQLQKWCVQYVRQVHPCLTVIAIPNGGMRSPIEAARMKGTGTRAGVSDLMFLLRDQRVYWAELKTLTGRIGPAQLEWQLELDMKRHKHTVIRTQDEWVALCRRLDREEQARAAAV